MTACKDCKFFLYITRNDNFENDNPIWYSMFCEASPIPPKFDPYAGEFKQDEDERFHYCRDINTGECPKFEPKKDATA